MTTLSPPRQGMTSKQALNVAFEHHTAQRYPQAKAIYEQIIKYEPNNAHALHLLGVLEFQVGRYMRSVELIERAIAVRGGISDFYTNLGEVWRALESYEKAIACHQKAIELEPANADIRVNLASALADANQATAAREQYVAAYQLLAGDPKSLIALCGKLEMLNQTLGARVIVDAAKAVYPNEPGLTLIDAKLDRREGRAQMGMAKLEQLRGRVNDPLLEVRINFELGSLYDRAGCYSQAYAMFDMANGLRGKKALMPEIEPGRALERVTGMSDMLTPEWLASWQPATPAFDRRAPVFLVGFPRSGTTLLEQITSSHSQICSAEERPLIEMLKSILKSCGMSYPSVIVSLKEPDIQMLRAAYFNAADVMAGMSMDNKILLDKLPLHIADMPFIHRVFPDAKFIFMLRHPMDSILSCFMQDFKLNDAMANFLRLEDAAKFYDAVMRLWRKSVELMPINYHIVRYENLVADLNGETQPLLDFLGLPWEESLFEYQKKARVKKLNTPSYSQVSEPLYSRAVNRWQRYGEFMAPILPVIDPWVEYFGYKKIIEREW